MAPPEVLFRMTTEENDNELNIKNAFKYSRGPPAGDSAVEWQ